MRAKFAMVIAPSSTAAGVPRDGEAALAARIASGPGLWTEWLAELDRQGLLEDLLAENVIARALREAPARHKYDRVLTARMTAICVLVACLFPGAGYDTVLATAFGLPGLRFRPGAEVPSGSAFSQARKLLGEQVMKRLFELDAAVADADLGIGLLWKGLEVTAIDGTTMELARNDVLEGEFGTPADGARPMLRVTAHVRTATFRWTGAAIGGYHDGENALADQLEDSFRPGILNLADRGFFSMHRWIRFSARGADLAWRIKNGAKSVPLKTIKTLPDGSELVIMHESDGMRTRRRRDTGNPHAGRFPDTTARLVTFTITAVTRSGRTKTTRMRVLTTLLDHEACPAAEIAALYAERWQIEIAFLHLKKTVRGPRRPLRGQSPELARQEAWALLLIHNLTATASARAAGSAGLDPGLIPFTAVL
ncbi:MAG TPA: IS4 family transposase, partial [Streptosporangiaceae bacterium]